MISQNVAEALENYRFDEALSDIWSRVRAADQYISENEVWKQTGDKKQESVISLVTTIRQIATDLQPFMPETAKKIVRQYEGPKIEKEEALFPRLS